MFLLLQACLGLTIRASETRIYFFHPRLPESLQQVRIRDLKVGHSSIDLDVVRYGETVSVVRQAGDLDIVMVK